MLLNAIKKELNKTTTTNGAITNVSSMDSIVDFFAVAGALRNATVEGRVKSFAKAYLADREIALKTLFYIRDIRGGQGERDTFRDIFSWLVSVDEPTCIANMENIVKYGRWDDLLQIALYCDGSRFTSEALSLIKRQLILDLKEVADGKSPSLLGKWMWSENTSSKETVGKAHWLRTNLGASPKAYRKVLSKLRKEIGIVETKISNKDYESINYEHVPSLAMTKYRTAFFRNDESGMSEFVSAIENGEKKINASTLYPYDLVRPLLGRGRYYSPKAIPEDAIIEKQWEALPNYIGSEEWNGLVVADVSGSMSGLPMEVSVSLAMYISERNNGYFKNHFITFSDNPSLQVVTGDTLVEKVSNLEKADWGGSTNLKGTFDLILRTAKKNNLSQSDIPNQLFVITDMQFDCGTSFYDYKKGTYVTTDVDTLMQEIAKEWKSAGYEVPKLVWWNVNASSGGGNFPMTVDEAGVQYVSGCSPVILKTLLSGEFLSPLDVVKNTVCTERYESVIVL